MNDPTTNSMGPLVGCGRYFWRSVQQRTSGDSRCGVRSAARDDQTAAWRITMDGNRLVPERLGGEAEGRRGGETDLHHGRKRWGASGRLLNGRPRSEPWAHDLDR